MSVMHATIPVFGITEEKMQRLERICSEYEKNYGGVNYTPNQLVDLSDITTSTIADFDTATELIHFEYEIAKPAIGSVTHQLQTSGAVQHSDVLIIIRNADYVNKLKNNLYKGTTVPTMKIIKLQNENDVKQKSQEIEFTNCKVQYIRPVVNFQLFTLRYEAIKDTIFKRKQDNSEDGQLVSGFDLRTVAVVDS